MTSQARPSNRADIARLIGQFDRPGPRYTSYPTALEWKQKPSPTQADGLIKQNNDQRGDVPLSLYLHIPFCAKLCYYCACNKKITQRDSTVTRYLDVVYQEIEAWAARLGSGRRVVQIHWGGGTPTHLTPEQISEVSGAISKAFEVSGDAEISVEVHPAVTTRAHLQALRTAGFGRVSMGVQDFDPKVQEAVNRIQPFEQTRDLIEDARDLGYSSVNVDLIYGLPYQTLSGFSETLDRVEDLRPERIALFNYAHMPSRQPGQRMIDEATLPPPDAKLDIFESAILRFVSWGYQYIGMDHFAHPDDELSIARYLFGNQESRVGRCQAR